MGIAGLNRQVTGKKKTECVSVSGCRKDTEIENEQGKKFPLYFLLVQNALPKPATGWRF